MSNKKTFKQHTLKSGDTQTTCWLEARKDVEIGTRITLKDDERVWTVTSIGSTVRDSQQMSERARLNRSYRAHTDI